MLVTRRIKFLNSRSFFRSTQLFSYHNTFIIPQHIFRKSFGKSGDSCLSPIDLRFDGVSSHLSNPCNCPTIPYQFIGFIEQTESSRRDWLMTRAQQMAVDQSWRGKCVTRVKSYSLLQKLKCPSFKEISSQKRRTVFTITAKI